MLSAIVIALAGHKPICASSNNGRFTPTFETVMMSLVHHLNVIIPQTSTTTLVFSNIRYWINLEFLANEKRITSTVPSRGLQPAASSHTLIAEANYSQVLVTNCDCITNQRSVLHPCSASRKKKRICCDFKGGYMIYVIIWYRYMWCNYVPCMFLFSTFFIVCSCHPQSGAVPHLKLFHPPWPQQLSMGCLDSFN